MVILSLIFKRSINYFLIIIASLIKLFSDLYPAKFSNSSGKLFFLCTFMSRRKEINI